jgi:hypothetical protein
MPVLHKLQSAMARSELGHQAFELEFQRGQEVTHEESIALGLAASAADDRT